MSWHCSGCGETVQDGQLHNCLDVSKIAQPLTATPVAHKAQHVLSQHEIEEIVADAIAKVEAAQ